VDGVLGPDGDVLCALREQSENLIQAVNIVGSIFYGVVLGLVLVAFFFKTVRGTAVLGALAAGAYSSSSVLNISYLCTTSLGVPPACCSVWRSKASGSAARIMTSPQPLI
jgi:hypothetical protein